MFKWTEKRGWGRGIEEERGNVRRLRGWGFYATNEFFSGLRYDNKNRVLH